MPDEPMTRREWLGGKLRKRLTEWADVFRAEVSAMQSARAEFLRIICDEAVAAEELRYDVEVLRYERDQARELLNFFRHEWPCPEMHADPITNTAHPENCPEASHDVEEYCFSAKINALLDES